MTVTRADLDALLVDTARLVADAAGRSPAVAAAMDQSVAGARDQFDDLGVNVANPEECRALVVGALTAGSVVDSLTRGLHPSIHAAVKEATGAAVRSVAGACGGVPRPRRGGGDVSARARPCPTCGAGPGRPCTTATGYKAARPHLPRLTQPGPAVRVRRLADRLPAAWKWRAGIPRRADR